MLWTDPVYLKMLGWVVLAVACAYGADRWRERRVEMRRLREGRVAATCDDVRG